MTPYLPIDCRYKIAQAGLIATTDLSSGLYIDFHAMIARRVSSWQIGPETLLTRLGGIIGVGKNLVWIIIFLFTTLSTFSSYFKRRFFEPK